MMEQKIRFKGFEGEWKTSTIGEIAPLSGGYAFQSNHFSSVGIPIVRISNILETGIVGGVFAKYATFDGDADFRLYDGDAVIAMSGATTGKVAIVHTQGFLYQNQRVGKFTKTDRVIYDFLTTIVKSHKFRADLSCLLTSSAQPNASSKDIDSITHSIPLDKDEQPAIGKYFTSLDSQISASTSRLASLKQMKAASLQAMFPQEGETVPKIRFKGFEGEWKKVMFSETFEFLKNNSLSRAELSNEGDIVNVHYGDVLIKYGDLLNIQNEELTFIADNKIGNTLYNSCHLQNGDIIIADAAEDNTVGKCSEIVNICNKRVVSGLHTIPCRPLNRFAQGYLGHYINSESYHNQLLPLIQGSKISSISKKTLSQTIVLVPSIEEQKCIGNYFTSLDRQISLQSQRLEKLKQIKSACLDKMFV